MRTFLTITAVMLSIYAGPARAEMISGEVRRIDEAANKITLRHGPAKSLGMDEPMTMVYGVRDPAVLKQVKVGDKVQFEAENANGAYTVITIQKVQ